MSVHMSHSEFHVQPPTKLCIPHAYITLMHHIYDALMVYLLWITLSYVSLMDHIILCITHVSHHQCDT